MLSAHLECFGSGADVVLLHGTPVAPEHLHPLAHELGAEFRVWVAHLPGYGQTPALPAGHSAADIQEAVERALVARGVSSAALVGLSAGAYHALGMALRGTVEVRVKAFVRRLRWKGPVFAISALTREGCEPLIRAVYQHVSALRQPQADAPDPRFADAAEGAGVD